MLKSKQNDSEYVSIEKGNAYINDEDIDTDDMTDNDDYGDYGDEGDEGDVKGDPENGKNLYAPCVACHGAQGEGNPALNSPALGGQDGAYLAEFLLNKG